jgi:GntR family transcriptional regulator/MocR family aminotransferase
MALGSPAPLRIAQRICDAIKAQIAAGLLAPGARVPSTRALAVEWGVSRTTVTAAYEQLIAEGYLETRRGAHTRVAAGLGLGMVKPSPEMFPHGLRRLSDYGKRLVAWNLPIAAERPMRIADFRYGDLSAGDFPKLAWKKAVTIALLRRPERLRYDDPSGSTKLRKMLQGYLWRARGLRCTLEQILVVNGSQQALDLCARLFLNAGDRVLMEDPGYVLARQIFVASGADVVPVAVDHEGLRTAGLPVARLAYTTPSHQFPLGGVLSAGRRQELLAWAQRTGAYVIEDDYDSEYRFDIAPIPPLQALDQAGRVIYVGTVSKTLSPTLRLGYLVVPHALAVAFAGAKRLADRHSPSLEQDALAELIESGAYERHIRRVRRRNAERRAALLDALAVTLGGLVSVVGAEAGLHVVAWLNGVPRAEEATLIARARAVELGLYPVSSLYASEVVGARPENAGLVMGYASLDEPAIRRGVHVLGELLRTSAKGE